DKSQPALVNNQRLFWLQKGATIGIIVVVTTTPIDLTPFGFTPTESLVYGRLLTGGPASGYAVSRDLLVARANVYQALRALVAKGAAVSTGEKPQRFRAVKPRDLYAGIVERENGKLDSLEAQILE